MVESKKKNPAIIHETSGYIGLARLVTDLAEQWLEEEEARVTGFTVVGSRPAAKSIHRVRKEAFVKRDRRSAGCYSRQESKNRFD